MRKGFTILELLVASLLLGMLLSILTMIFNQSSIAWRTGVAGVAQMDDVRSNVGNLRDEADNVFAHGNMTGLRIISLWDDNGDLRTRACNTEGESGVQVSQLSGISASSRQSSMQAISVGSSSGRSRKTYMVGVLSYGPDGEVDTYDDITSWPDEVE